jgi:hypothetical protein
MYLPSVLGREKGRELLRERIHIYIEEREKRREMNIYKHTRPYINV